MTGRFTGFCTKTKIFCTNSAEGLVEKSGIFAGLKKVNAFLLSMPSPEFRPKLFFDYIFVYLYIKGKSGAVGGDTRVPLWVIITCETEW